MVHHLLSPTWSMISMGCRCCVFIFLSLCLYLSISSVTLSSVFLSVSLSDFQSLSLSLCLLSLVSFAPSLFLFFSVSLPYISLPDSPSLSLPGCLSLPLLPNFSLSLSVSLPISLHLPLSVFLSSLPHLSLSLSRVCGTSNGTFISSFTWDLKPSPSVLLSCYMIDHRCYKKKQCSYSKNQYRSIKVAGHEYSITCSHK